MKNTFKKVLNNQLFQKTLKLSGVSFGANFIGFLIPVFIAYKFPISKKTDSFFLSYGIILFIGGVFSGAVRNVAIPFLKEHLDNKATYNHFISNLLYYSIKFLILLCGVLFLVIFLIYHYTDHLLYWYLFLSVPIVFFSVLSSLGYGVLNSLDKFYIAEASLFSRGIIILLTIFLFYHYWGISAVIIGYNFGELAKCFHLWFVIKRMGVTIQFKKKEFSLIKPFLKQGSFQILSTSLSSTSPLVDSIVASFMIAGSVTLISYGDRLFMVFNILLSSFFILILSKWSKDFIDNKFTLVKLHKAMLLIFSITLLLFLVIALFKTPIVSTIYPNVSNENQLMIAIMLVLNMAGFIFDAVSQVVNRASIATRSTDIMVITAIFKVIVNIILDIIFARIWGVVGIVVATIGVQIMALSINYFLFRRRIAYHKRVLNTKITLAK